MTKRQWANLKLSFLKKYAQYMMPPTQQRRQFDFGYAPLAAGIALDLIGRTEGMKGFKALGRGLYAFGTVSSIMRGDPIGALAYTLTPWAVNKLTKAPFWRTFSKLKP